MKSQQVRVGSWIIEIEDENDEGTLTLRVKRLHNGESERGVHVSQESPERTGGLEITFSTDRIEAILDKQAELDGLWDDEHDDHGNQAEE